MKELELILEKTEKLDKQKIIQKVIEIQTDEKFLIHCGFAHLMEGN